jgi:minor extracellular serine protease Vpr
MVPGAAPAALANDDPTSRFEAIDVGGGTPRFTPLGLDANRRVTVFVEMVGDPVAVVRGNASDNKISDAQKQSIKRDLKGKQDALRPRIASSGATVLADFQVALNGLKVNVERGRVAQLAALPGVIAIRDVETFEMNNTKSVALIGAPAAWDGVAGFRGEGIKVGIIDTGIDYTHANFGGPGTVAAYAAANAADTTAPNPAHFGPEAAKVKGGTDLVGDTYNASAAAGSPDLVPHPDPNPLDCNGHGSHVAGTAAGFGVLNDGATYSGTYTAATHTSTAFRIGPGVAPKADIYGIRVFGCAGSTNVVAEAIEWAVDNDLDVINMSLGSVFGTSGGASATAATNAAKAGVTVVASAGNNGAAQYITGSPGSGDGVISVAANDANTGFATVTMALSTGQTIVGINANGATFSDGTTLPVKVLKNTNGSVSLGCKHPSGSLGADGTNEWVDVAGKVVVTLRGTCARVARAVFGQKEGAAAVVMLNTDTGLPPFEGQITSNPDTGEQYTVTIPFIGVRGLVTTATSDAAKMVAADAGTATLTNSTQANANFTGFATFSSGGPRNGDSVLKPDITAPGVSTVSTQSGSGNGATIISGTSMAAPMVAGVAALTRQAHPGWRNADISAAIVNTGNPAQIGGAAPYRTSRGGTGQVQPAASTKTQTVATGDKGFTSLRFGFKELDANLSETKSVTLRNNGTTAATFGIAATNAAGSPHSIALGASSVTVPAGGTASVNVTLNVTAATAGNAAAFREVAGLVTFTPNGSSNSGVALRVPYYLVPRTLSNLNTKLDGKLNATTSTSTTATTTNEGGVIAGTADFYAWGLEDGKDKFGGPTDLRAVGVQSFAFGTTADPNRRLIVFAVNTWDRWSNAASSEYDIFIDVDNNGTDDFAVVGVDLGAVTAGVFNGQMGAFVFDLRTTPNTFAVDFLASAPTDSTTLLLPILSSRLAGLSQATNPRFTYSAASFAIVGTGDDVLPGTSKFNAWSSSISQGQFSTVGPGGSATNAVSINAAEWALTPAKGLMIVTRDNKNGAKEADLLEVSKP